MRHAFMSLFIYLIQHLTALITQAIMNLAMAYRAKTDEIGINIQTVREPALQVNRDSMMRLHVRLMRALCHKSLMSAIHLAVIVSDCQGLLPQDIRSCPVLDLIAPRLFCDDRHWHIQLGNIMMKAKQVRSLGKFHPISHEIYAT